MTRHNRSILFTLLTSICNIIITLIIVLGITGSFVFICWKIGLVKEGADNTIFMVVLPFVFFASLVISLKTFVHFARWVISTFKLETKLDPKIVHRYSKNNDNAL